MIDCDRLRWDWWSANLLWNINFRTNYGLLYRCEYIHCYDYSDICSNVIAADFGK